MDTKQMTPEETREGEVATWILLVAKTLISVLLFWLVSPVLGVAFFLFLALAEIAHRHRIFR
jgi:hypothetical protein